MSALAKHIIKRHLQKTAKKNWKSILSDIEAVCDGIKPSFLYDYSYMAPQELSEMMRALASSSYADMMKDKQLQVLSLGQDTFLANIPRLQTVLQETHRCLGQGNGQVAVDVSAHLDRPRPLHRDALRQLQDHVADVLVQLQDSNCELETVLELEPKKGWNFSTMFGVLIGYPVLYWYEQCTKNVSNCLSMVPLCVYTVTCITNHTSTEKDEFSRSQTTSRGKRHAIQYTGCNFLGNRHPVYSFSVPQELVPDFEDRIDVWFKGIQEGTGHKLEKTCSSVTLPAVAL